MNPEQRKKVQVIVADVFKTMAFMFAEPMDGAEMAPLTRDKGDWVKAWMEFRGPSVGSLTMFFPAELCSLIAASVLGIDSGHEKAAARGRDAVAELLNVVCGHILTGFAGEKPVFDLTVPQAADIEPTEVEALCCGNCDALAFSVEGKPLFIALLWRESRA